MPPVAFLKLCVDYLDGARGVCILPDATRRYESVDVPLDDPIVQAWQDARERFIHAENALVKKFFPRER